MPAFKTPLFRSGTVMGRAMTAILLSATLAGCAAQSGGPAMMKAEPTFMRLTEERVFAQALRQRYLELATNAYDRGDFDRSDFYSLRAIMAVEGKLVDPAGAGGHTPDELVPARARLSRALSTDARLGSPDLAARAQAAFDCWWLESQDGGDPQIASACAYNTEAALAELESVASGNLIARAVNKPQQIVINGQTPSQTMNVGGATIEVINSNPAPAPVPASTGLRRAPASMPAQPNYVRPYSATPAPEPMVVEEQAYMPPPLAPMPMEPVEEVSARTFVIEPSFQSDTVIPTVPLSDDTGPIDLTAGYTPPPAEESSFGGQYVVSDMENYAALMVPDHSEPMPAPVLFEQPMVAPAMPAPDTVIPTVPVFSDSMSPPAMPAPVMVEQKDGVLASLIEARSAGSSDFSVYFGFDSDEITPEAADILSDTVAELKSGNRETVSLMGFTDSAGDSRYNQLLAMRRANAVRQFIQQRSGRSVRFEVMPVGEAEAVRDGGDGVTDALNRRVEIILR